MPACESTAPARLSSASTAPAGRRPGRPTGSGLNPKRAPGCWLSTRSRPSIPRHRRPCALVDYHVLGAPEQFRVYADDEGDVARWIRVESPSTGCPADAHWLPARTAIGWAAGVSDKRPSVNGVVPSHHPAPSAEFDATITASPQGGRNSRSPPFAGAIGAGKATPGSGCRALASKRSDI